MERIVCKLKQEIISLKGENRPVYTVEVMGSDTRTPSLIVLFTQEYYAQKLASLCNEYDIDPIHILDIMEDLLYDVEMKI